MKNFSKFSFLCKVCVLYVFRTVVSTEKICEHISSSTQYSDVVDPNSLYYNPVSQEIKVPEDNGTGDDISEPTFQSVNNHQTYCKDNQYEVFSRRLINLLILSSNFKIKNGVAFGKLGLETTVEELDILKSFGEGKFSVRQVDHIISNIIRQPEISLFHEGLNYSDRLAVYLYQHRVISGTALLILFVIVIALKIKWTRLKIVILMFDIIIIVSFFLTWWELLQESEIKLTAQHHIYSGMPDECRQHEINFIRSVWLFFGIGKGDCLKYYEGVMADPVLKVTPLHAFSHMSMKFFFYPLTVASNFLSDFIENITSSLWFPFNHITKLLLILSVPSFICTLIFILLGGSMGVRFGPFFHIYLHGKQSIPFLNSLASNERQTIEIIHSETREVDTVASAESKPALIMKEIKNLQNKKSTKDENITTVQTRIQYKDADHCKCKRQQENSNHDDYSEENEYEKLFKINREKDMNKRENMKETTETLGNDKD